MPNHSESKELGKLMPIDGGAILPSAVSLTYLDPRLEPLLEPLPQPEKDKARSLGLCDLLAASDYTQASGPEHFGRDQLEEFLECLDLLIQNDASFAAWCRMPQQEVRRKKVLTQIQHWQKDKTNKTSEILTEIFWRAFVGTTEWVVLTLDDDPAKPVASTMKTVGSIDVCTDDGKPLLTADGCYIKAKLLDLENPSRTIPCRLRKPEWFDDEDVLHLKSCLASAQSALLGRLDTDDEFQIYVTLTLGGEERSIQWYYPFHFKRIAKNAKTPLHRSHFPFSGWPEGVKDVMTQLQGTTCLDDLALILGRLSNLWRLTRSADPDPISLEEIGAYQELNGGTFISLILHILCRMTLEFETIPIFKQLRCSLGIIRQSDYDARYVSETPVGNRLCLILTDHAQAKKIVLHENGMLVNGERALSSIVYSHPVELPRRYSSSTSTSLQKYVPADGITYTGDACVGNELACVAFGCVGGEPRQEIIQFKGDRAVGGVMKDAAAWIPLENRHQMTAKLPEPWQSNLRKLLEVCVDNPNIRHLVVFGKSADCDHTIGYLRDWKKPPHHTEQLPTEYFPPDLVERFHRQITPDTFEVIEGDIVGDITLLWKLKKIIEASYLGENCNQNQPRICETSCFSESVWSSESAVDTADVAPLLPDLSAIRAVGQTVRDVYPRVVESVRYFGEKKRAMDAIGRTYRELLSFRIEVNDPTIEQVPLGFDKNELDRNFRAQWLGDGWNGNPNTAPFYERMHYTFKDKDGKEIDQVNRVKKEIKACIQKPKVSRSILINIHHAGMDSRTPLGLNTIHFTLDPSDSTDTLGEWRLHASYIWRTVDVLGGFPFNLHAAASFLCHLVEECNQMLSQDSGGGRVLKPGKLIIIALNLHLYEGLDRRIARQVVLQSISDMTSRELL